VVAVVVEDVTDVDEDTVVLTIGVSTIIPVVDVVKTGVTRLEVVDIGDTDSTTFEIEVGLVNLLIACKYPGQVGEDIGFETQGSIEYFNEKDMLVTSGPYGPAQLLLSLPIKPYCTLPIVVISRGVANVSDILKFVQSNL